MKKVTNKKLLDEVKSLASMQDEDIDFSDIPETVDFKGWVRVGNKSLSSSIKESIEKQKLSVNWDDVNVLLHEIQHNHKKRRISLRLDSDIADYYRNQGKKYQTRINDILKAFMLSEKKSKMHSHI